MVLIIFLIIFILGICSGSFLNVVIYRLPKSKSVVWGRSFCPRCKKKILWFDNIPLVSFVLLRGKCRSCGKGISWQYPLVELATGILFVLAVSSLSNLSNLSYLGELLFRIILFSGLLVIFVIDLQKQIIPDSILFPLIIVSLINLIFRFILLTTNYYLLAIYIVSALCAFLFLCFIYLITKGKGMGFGDVKLAFLMGLVLGYPEIIVAFYLAFLTGAFLGVTLIIVRKLEFGQKIAFGPFLTFATLISYLWGEKIFVYFQNLLF